MRFLNLEKQFEINGVFIKRALDRFNEISSIKLWPRAGRPPPQGCLKTKKKIIKQMREKIRRNSRRSNWKLTKKAETSDRTSDRTSEAMLKWSWNFALHNNVEAASFSSHYEKGLKEISSCWNGFGTTPCKTPSSLLRNCPLLNRYFINKIIVFFQYGVRHLLPLLENALEPKKLLSYVLRSHFRMW